MAPEPPPKLNAIEMFEKTADNYDENTGGCTVDVARYFLSRISPITSTSNILDNAAGTGAVAQVILRPFKLNQTSPPHITLVDPAKNMIRVAEAEFKRRALPAQHTKLIVSPAEDLSALGDDAFTHSFTNMGIPMFNDGPKAAREIYRTLKPGGTAVVTSWEKLGYIPAIREAQALVLPGTEPFDVPMPKEWFEPEHLKGVMQDAGFANVQLSSCTVYYAAETNDKIAGFLVRLTKALPWMNGKEEEILATLKKTVGNHTKVVKKVLDKGDDEVEVELFGLPMVAIVAICTK